MNNSHHHIPFAQLVDLVEGILPEAERERLISHTAVCLRCANEMTQIERLIDLMRTDVSTDAPPFVLSKALSLLRIDNNARRRIVAVPQFDSRGFSPAFGIRSGDFDTGRHILLNADVCDIDLRIRATGHDWVVSGQLLGGDLRYGQAELSGRNGAVSMNLNEQSEFVFQPVKAGRYQLTFHLLTAEIQVDDLDVGT